MGLSNIPLRELKKARAKLALYHSALELIEKKMFHEVMLEDICRKAEVSRVTFFKFFPKKEDVLVYFMRVWLTERIIEIDTLQKRGFDAIRHLLIQVANQAEDKPGLLPSLISFLAEMNMHPAMPELSEAEVRLLFPEHIEAGRATPDMLDLFTRAMEEAHDAGTLNPLISIDTASKVLFTIFYGTYLTAQQFGSEDIIGFYEEHLQLLEKNT
ncbi:TetR/AcrR family transcriptional regulator [Paenibacillus senegalimassiliensis]|uniref:TetR/AcrR family transcriptional regulator n=1 Tax=Paenibacillus senegalimassiliensis TaxID=1737426 RepID=UPI00073F0DB0|nr:TetR/AcrR family transcriptional regulator [Paenibacillus senegalimassiliensis]